MLDVIGNNARLIKTLCNVLCRLTTIMMYYVIAQYNYGNYDYHILDRFVYNVMKDNKMKDK